MKNTARLFAAALLFAPSVTFAQSADGKGVGLDALDEHAVYNQLITLKLKDLAKRDMAQHKVPDAEQEQITSLTSLEELVHPTRALTASQRRELAVSAANGLEGFLARSDDAAVLLDDANKLVLFGVNPTVNELDYFGDNPVAQAQLKPVAATAKKLYDKASAIFGKKIDVIANGFTAANADKLTREMRAIGAQKDAADFYNHMTSYAACISYDRKDPARGKIADEAVDFLKQYDNPDSTIQTTIKNQTGKLLLAKGDYPGARAVFDAVIKNPGDAIKPAPTPVEQNDARYFDIVAELRTGNVNGAAADTDTLDAWEKSNLHLDPGQEESVAASLAMLKFLTLTKKADITNDESDKKKLNDSAITTLADLLRSQRNNPNLRDLIFDQLRGRIGPHADFASLDTLALRAVQQQAFDEFHDVTVNDKKPDTAVLERGIAASRELVNRAGQPGVDADVVDESARFVPFCYQFALHRDADAADGYIDYATRFQGDLKNATDAVGNAGQIIFFELKKKQDDHATTAKDDARLNKLMERYLPLAINPPFNNKKLAFQYGKLLFDQKHFADAVKYLDMVPEADSRYGTARFLMTVALSQQLTDPAQALPADQHRPVAERTVQLAKQTEAASLASAASATNDKDRGIFLERAASAIQTAANVTRGELKDPATSLKILDRFEQKIHGVGDAKREQQLDLGAMRLRVNDLLDTNQVNEAGPLSWPLALTSRSTNSTIAIGVASERRMPALTIRT